METKQNVKRKEGGKVKDETVKPLGGEYGCGGAGAHGVSVCAPQGPASTASRRPGGISGDVLVQCFPPRCAD